MLFDLYQNKRFLLAGVFSKFKSYEEILSEFEELDLLVKTYGGITCALISQKAFKPSFTGYLGRGKTDQTIEKIAEEKIDVVILNDTLRQNQIYFLEKIFRKSYPHIVVWDKNDLILHIFDLHAQTSEANLQIKIAALKHMGPRIFGMGYELSRQVGGIGTRGIGETNTEIMKRHWRQEIFSLKKKINELEKTRLQQIDRRKKLGVMTVSIIGYTNSGKTSLFNVLTKKNKFSADKLFATLDSASGKIYFPDLKKEVLLTDTIGFIRNLPPNLIDSFKSTLLESVNADLILQVIDVSDKEMFLKIKVVEQILENLKLNLIPQIYVFNKTDAAPEADKAKLKKQFINYNPQFISALNSTGIHILKEEIGKFIRKSAEERT